MEEIRDLAGLPDTASAVQAAAATVGVLSHLLQDEDRRHVEEALPGKLREAMAADAVSAKPAGRSVNQIGFVAEVAGRCGCSTEKARLRAQATLAVLAHHEPELFSSLRPPEWLEELSSRPDPGGGVVSARGSTPPLTDEEVRRVLDDLADWTGDTHQLRRSVLLPPENVQGLMPAIEAVLRDTGHGGDLQRTDDGLTVTLRTRSVDAVTTYDVETARRIEDVLGSLGAAIATPKPAKTTQPSRWSRPPRVLFGGTGLWGWRMCGAGSFEVVDAALQTRGGMGMLWYAERQFPDFVLTLDWRVARPSDNGGVFVRFPDPGKDPLVAVNQGYEIQLCDAGEGDQRTGAIYGFAAPYAEPPVNAPGEWNHLEVHVEGQTYRVGVNGREITSFRGTRSASGYVGLQNHDDRSSVQYRNVWVFDQPPQR